MDEKPRGSVRADNRLMRVLAGTPATPPPLWLMRQAGRYLPEYRAVRAEAGSFLDLCFSPAQAAEVTLQPIRRFGFDAAILFSDILVVPHALGRTVRFVEGEGPRLEPIDAAGIEALDEEGIATRLAPVYETVARLRQDLPRETALIGFCGAPFTVATYMVAGKGSPDQAPTRLFAARDPAAFGRLIDRLVTASADYLLRQVAAGADVLMIFDSWAGALAGDDFLRWSVEPIARIVETVRAAAPGVPVIGFPKGAGLGLETFLRRTGVDAVGLDWTVPLEFARDRLQPLAALQGNLDPMVLVAGGTTLDRAVDRILETLGSGRLIFNLGHGIVPETPIAHVERLVERVRRGG